MSVARSSLMPRGIVAVQIGVLLIGLAASAVPVVAKSLTFWGSMRSWSKLAPDRISIDLVDPDSPLGVAGLQDHDEVLSIDGNPIVSPQSWTGTIDQLRAGQEAKLRVKRGDRELTVTVKGIDPENLGYMYFYWQIAFAGECLVFIVLLMATQSMSPKSSIWRPLLLAMVGFVTVVVLLMANLQSRLMLFDSSRAIDPHVSASIQKIACITVTVVVIALAAWEVRSKVAMASRHEQYLEGATPL
jgi:hypothetical protein